MLKINIWWYISAIAVGLSIWFFTSDYYQHFRYQNSDEAAYIEVKKKFPSSKIYIVPQRNMCKWFVIDSGKLYKVSQDNLNSDITGIEIALEYEYVPSRNQIKIIK